MSIHVSEKLQAYWKQNLTYIAILLSIWFAVSYLFGILLVDQLDAIQIGGFKLGFWFANQGSEVIFVLLIVVYVQLMNALDKKYDVHED
jgi:putative solute:sodium symporter small subunit